MKKEKVLMKVIGVVLILVALWVALYIGIWKCFCMPIGEIIESIGVNAVEGKKTAVNVLKLVIGTAGAETIALFIGSLGFGFVLE